MTGDLIKNELADKTEQPNGLLTESVESIEMKALNTNNNNNNVIPIASPVHLPLHVPPDCCAPSITKHFDCCKSIIPRRIQRQWAHLRSEALRLVEHRFFEWLIIASILASSTTLVSSMGEKELIESVHSFFARHWKISMHDKIRRIQRYCIPWINYSRLSSRLN